MTANLNPNHNLTLNHNPFYTAIKIRIKIMITKGTGYFTRLVLSTLK